MITKQEFKDAAKECGFTVGPDGLSINSFSGPSRWEVCAYGTFKTDDTIIFYHGPSKWPTGFCYGTATKEVLTENMSKKDLVEFLCKQKNLEKEMVKNHRKEMIDEL